jgi:hypothetical protein
VASCARCGGKLPKNSKFCPACGTRVGAEPGETAVQELPPDETGPVPVNVVWAERRYFGVTPPTAILALAVGSAVLAVALLVSGRLAWGLIVLSVAFLLLAAFAAHARRVPVEPSGVAKASIEALEAVRARAEAAFETVAAHGSARIELMRLRKDVGELAAAKVESLRALGEAVYEGNRKATKELKQQTKELDDQIRAKEEKMEQVAEQTQERIEQAQLQVQPTQVVRAEEAPGEEPDQVPEPARVPEPFPPPDEGEPPQPARIPEPFPPPDEGDRPQQPTIPEPGPTGKR